MNAPLRVYGGRFFHRDISVFHDFWLCRRGGTFMTLNEIKPGVRAVVTAVNGNGAMRRRLLDMGLVPGTEVHVIRRAPAGDPIEVGLRGYSLTLRRSDAQIIDIR